MMRVFLAALIFAITTIAAMAEPVPDWVTTLERPEAADTPQDFTHNGVLYLIKDRQVRLTEGGYEDFERRVVQISNRTGLEQEGALRLDYDPQDETLVVHDVWRIRDGVRSRVTGLEFIDIRRETEMDYGILDGRLTHYADVPDLRVGDILDVATSRIGAPPVFDDYFLTWVAERPISPFQVHRDRLLTRDAQDIVVSGPAKPVVSRHDGWTERVWLHENTPYESLDGYWQDFDAYFGYTQVTTASTWAEIVNTILPSYQPLPLPADLSETVRGFSGTEAQRVTAAFRFVQDEIRYMGIEIGDGGYLPRPPELVWNRRFGDCKDKALLLVSMLAEMGIAADVALVNSREGDRLNDRAPSPFVFNHAIVRVLGEDGTYFLDPTDVLQGGVGDQVRVPDYTWALPLTADSDGLVPVPQIRPEAASYEVLTRYEFKDSGAWAAELIETTTFRGEDADAQRYRFKQDGADDRAESYLEWYQDRFPGTEVLTPLRIEDDRDANILVVHEHYGLTDDGLAERRANFWMNPYAVAGELEDLPDEDLTEAYPLDPLYHRHRVEIVGYDGLNPPPDFKVDNALFRYTKTGYEVPGGVGGDFEIEVLVDEVTPDQAQTYRDAMRQHDENDDRRYVLSGSVRILAADMWMGLPLGRWLTIGALLAAISVFLSGAVAGYRRERAELMISPK